MRYLDAAGKYLLGNGRLTGIYRVYGISVLGIFEYGNKRQVKSLSDLQSQQIFVLWHAFSIIVA